jgi:hypothetical protein
LVNVIKFLNSTAYLAHRCKQGEGGGRGYETATHRQIYKNLLIKMRMCRVKISKQGRRGV